MHSGLPFGLSLYHLLSSIMSCKIGALLANYGRARYCDLVRVGHESRGKAAEIWNMLTSHTLAQRPKVVMSCAICARSITMRANLQNYSPFEEGNSIQTTLEQRQDSWCNIRIRPAFSPMRLPDSFPSCP